MMTVQRNSATSTKKGVLVFVAIPVALFLTWASTSSLLVTATRADSNRLQGREQHRRDQRMEQSTKNLRYSSYSNVELGLGLRQKTSKKAKKESNSADSFLDESPVESPVEPPTSFVAIGTPPPLGMETAAPVAALTPAPSFPIATTPAPSFSIEITAAPSFPIATTPAPSFPLVVEAPTVPLPTTLAPSASAPSVTPVSALLTETLSPTVVPSTFLPTFPLTPEPTAAPFVVSASPTWLPTPESAPPSDVPSLTPSSSPTALEIFQTSVGELGFEETTCRTTPSVGTTVTEIVEFEYLLYLSPPADEGNDAQSLVDSLEVKLHEALIAITMTCSDFEDMKYSVVGLSKGGSDKLEGICDVSNRTATSCYKVLATITVTVWNAILGRQRTLQDKLLGGGESFDQFVEWMLEAMTMLQDEGEGIAEVAFNGFVNWNGGELPDHPDTSSDVPTNALMGSAYSATDEGVVGFSFGMAAIAVGGLVLALIVVFTVTRRRRTHRAMLQHVKHVDDLRWDLSDDHNTQPGIVDDESLFSQSDKVLPDEYEIRLEDIHHDYRTCASPTCRACMERKEPIFVATEKRAFLAHLTALRPEKYRGKPSQVRFDDTQVL